MDLHIYGPGHIEAFLLNYEVLVRDLAEVATAWSTLDEEGRSDRRVEVMQAWGNRKVLGLLFTANRLSRAQEARLARLDYRLLEQASLMEQCYALDLRQLLAIFRWGTPLPRFVQTVQIEVGPASLDRMATLLALSATD